jgi:hypothetical protein
MCGINGIFAYHYAANPVDQAELMRTRDHMAARGPDAAGTWRAGDGRIGFGHRRLAIIDLTDGGAQPMANADGSLVVTFNGEIYNCRSSGGGSRRLVNARSHEQMKLLPSWPTQVLTRGRYCSSLRWLSIVQNAERIRREAMGLPPAVNNPAEQRR